MFVFLHFTRLYGPKREAHSQDCSRRDADSQSASGEFSQILYNDIILNGVEIMMSVSIIKAKDVLQNV